MGDLIRFPGSQLPITELPAEHLKPEQFLPIAKKPDERICWACGVNRTAHKESYCVKCSLAGRDSPWMNCKQDGCNTVKKRQYRGQQYFNCPQHPDATR